MDYYKVLGLRRDAGAEEIKAAFRELAFKSHPDRHMQASGREREALERRFREVSEAYEVLGDDQKRAIYNREGRAGLDRRHRQHPWSSSSSSSSSGRWSNPGSHSSSNSYYRGRGSSNGGQSNYWTYNRRFRWNSPEAIFHFGLVGVALIGSVFGDKIGNYVWNSTNSGKSFEDVMKARQDAQKEEARKHTMESENWQLNLDNDKNE